MLLYQLNHNGNNNFSFSPKMSNSYILFGSIKQVNFWEKYMFFKVFNKKVKDWGIQLDQYPVYQADIIRWKKRRNPLCIRNSMAMMSKRMKPGENCLLLMRRWVTVIYLLNLSHINYHLSRRRRRQRWSKRGESFQWCSPSLQSLSEATYMELQLSSLMWELLYSFGLISDDNFTSTFENEID